ncbi:MAG: nucleoside deaminase [Pseudomonadota bacterium]
MAIAIQEAKQAAETGEVPVGAVVVSDGEIIARAHNEMVRRSDPTAHAEIVALRRAGARLGTAQLTGCDLYVTLEPCAMCAGAIALARIRRLYFGASDEKGGAVEHGPRLYGQPTIHHRPEVLGGFCEAECADLLRAFFAARRGNG